MNYALGVTGYPSSGKSIVKDIAEEIGFKTISMGDQIRKRTRKNWTEILSAAEKGESVETPSDVYGEFATKMREKHGRGIVAKWCKEDILNSNRPVFIDGMRSPEERESFEEYIAVDLLFIHAPASLRYNWIKERARDDEDNFSINSFINRDKRENGWGLNELIQNADFTIHNCTTQENFESQIEDKLLEIYNNNS